MKRENKNKSEIKKTIHSNLKCNLFAIKMHLPEIEAIFPFNSYVKILLQITLHF